MKPKLLHSQKAARRRKRHWLSREIDWDEFEIIVVGGAEDDKPGSPQGSPVAGRVS